jgi:predicted DNA-binding transcriptional regulator AlpA
MEFMRPKDVMQKMKISRGKLYQLISEGLFPKPHKCLDRKTSIWLDSEVENAMTALFKNLDKDYIRKLVSDIEQSRQAWS